MYDTDLLSFKNPSSCKVLLNLAEYFTCEVKAAAKDVNSILGLALKIPDLEPHMIGRILTFIALNFSVQHMHIKAEGLFRGALERLTDDQYEKVECLYFYGLALKKIDIRASEAEDLIKQSRDLAAKMPPWENLSVKLFTHSPDMPIE